MTNLTKDSFICGGVLLDGVSSLALRKCLGFYGFKLVFTPTFFSPTSHRIVTLYFLYSFDTKIALKNINDFTELKKILYLNNFYFLYYSSNNIFFPISFYEKSILIWFNFFLLFYLKQLLLFRLKINLFLNLNLLLFLNNFFQKNKIGN